MGDKSRAKPQTSFLRSLLLDKRANTLAIGAAAVIPLIGVVGGGVDASRMYLAQSRLQQSCDSATLAARKKLAGGEVNGGVIPADVEETADKFFETNFGDGIYGTSNTTYELSSSVGTRMDGTAQTSVPVTLMTVFGYDSIDLSVDCSADLNLPNIDISLVLDMSGSMGDPSDASDSSSVSRMDALKSAVFAFYDEIMAAAPADARVRIGIVPYNSNVNVGQMINDVNPAYLANSHDYQSREAIWESVMTNPGQPGTPGGTDQLYFDETDRIPREKAWLGDSDTWSYVWSNVENSTPYGKANCNSYAGTYTVNGEKWVIGPGTYYRNFYRSGYTYYGACYGRIQKYRSSQGTPAIPPTYENQFKRYEYKEMNLDTSAFKKFESVSRPIGSQGSSVSSTWNGCIEEATTVAATTFDPIPSGAYDMNIDLVPDPSNVNTQWRPQWNRVTFDRGGKNQVNSTSDMPLKYGTCPSRAYPLTEYKLNGTNRNSDFETRINAMSAAGSTMHDIGMIWGARILSPDGIFSGTNTTAPNGDPIIRHLIFMTDGQMSPGPRWQNAYGNPDMDGHIAGFKSGSAKWIDDEAGLVTIHNARLDAICQQIKNKNITVWSISFGLPLNDHTRGCASGTSRAMTADNQSTLISRFRTIATSIAELRLVE